MGKPDYVLSFAEDGQGQLSIHGDARGLEILIEHLSRVREHVLSGDCSHAHLMTDSWGGKELSERAPAADGTLIHHVKAYGWTREWVETHGLASPDRSADDGATA